jgi:large subunit GTPase 1
MPRNQGTSRKGKPKKFEKAAGMGRSLLATGKKYTPRADGKNRLGGANGMAAVPGVTSIGESTTADPLLSSSTGGLHPRSILDMHDLDDFLLQASMAQREFVSERGTVDDQMLIVPDRHRTVQWQDQAPPSSAASTETTVMELSVPRRPPWTADLSREALEQQEQAAFLEWRRSIAHYEATLLENAVALSSIAPTPFEKNLNVWRQLWRVVERCHVVLQIVDARNPLFYLSYDLYKYVHLELGKPMMLVFNKSDYLTPQQRQQWVHYLQAPSTATSITAASRTTTPHWTAHCRIVFFSAAREQKRLDAEAAQERRRIEEEEKGSTPFETRPEQVPNLEAEEDDDEWSNEEGQESIDRSDEDTHLTLKEEEAASDVHIVDNDDELEEEEVLVDPVDSVESSTTRILSRSQLIHAMRSFAQEHGCQPDERYEHRIQFGMVGFPNVGKSSVINVLMGTSKHAHGTVRVAVASQPGKTKHFQTLLLPEPDSDSMLCDCPGLVFPSFVSNTADLIAAGVYPIAQMRDFWPVMDLICQRIPRAILNAHYGITLPVPTHQELRESGFVPGGAYEHLPRPTVDELLTTYCVARGFLASFSGVPDYQRAARIIIKDYADGKLLYCHPPPSMDDFESFQKDTIETALRQTQRTRERLLKQQQKVEAMNAATNGPVVPTSVIRKSKVADAMDDEFLQQMVDSTLDDTNEGKSKHHFKKKAGSRWGKKDRKNRNKDPYGCHSTPDHSLLQDVAISASVHSAAAPTTGSSYVRPTTFPVLTTGSKP